MNLETYIGINKICDRDGHYSIWHSGDQQADAIQNFCWPLTMTFRVSYTFNREYFHHMKRFYDLFGTYGPQRESQISALRNVVQYGGGHTIKFI